MNNSNTTYELNSIAVHLALLKTGKVILFSGDHGHIWDWNRGESSLWDPQNPQVHCDPMLKRNLFCSGHCFLPDGRLLVAGGQSTYNHPLTILLSLPGILQIVLKILKKEAADHDIHTFDPEKQKWQLHAKMPKARWYPTCVTLPDGNALIVSGTSSHAHHSLGFMNHDYEIFDPKSNTLSAPKKFMDKIEMYPFLQVLPGGILFVHSQKTTNFWNITEKKIISGIEFNTMVGGTKTYPGMGSCVLLPLEHDSETAKILIVGGSTSMSPNKNTDAIDTAEIFTVDLKDPKNSSGWQKTPPMINKRFLCDSVLLPDGTVLVTNGAAKGQADDNQIAVMGIELFDPNNNSWQKIGELQRARLYHSSAVLLPDARVVVAGSTGHHWVSAVFAPTEHFEHEIEIITPPYLKGNTTRPQLESVPSAISYDSSFDVGTNDAQDIRQVSLMRASSTTHNNNMDQRCLVLSILNRTNSTLKLSSPKDGSWAPAGYYLLFLVDSNGVPSVGKFVRVG